MCFLYVIEDSALRLSGIDDGSLASTLREAFFSRRFASRIHEISDLKKSLVLSLRAGYTRLRDQKKHTEHERNAKR